MRVITAVADLKWSEKSEPSVFLAGGITKCPDWQTDVIAGLMNVKRGVLLNPRRRNFPIHDPNAAEEQITWEYRALSRATVFSMWFSAGESDQPICMYELGRHLARFAHLGRTDLVLIGVEPGYRREQDVRIQTRLVSPKLADRIVDNLDAHVAQIRHLVQSW